MHVFSRLKGLWGLAVLISLSSLPKTSAQEGRRPEGERRARSEAREDRARGRSPETREALANLRKRRERAQGEIRLLEAQLNVRRAELEAVEAQWRLVLASEEAREVEQSLRNSPIGDDREGRGDDGDEGDRPDSEDEGRPESRRGPELPNDEGPSEEDEAIRQALDRSVAMPFPDSTPLEDVIRYIRKSGASEDLPNGIPIWVDPAGLRKAGARLDSKVTIKGEPAPLRESLSRLLEPLGLHYRVRDGLLEILGPVAGPEDEEAGLPEGPAEVIDPGTTTREDARRIGESSRRCLATRVEQGGRTGPSSTP